MREPHLRDWYRAEHDRRKRSTGQAFEAYTFSVLKHHHVGLMNPNPMGTLGDGGADAVTADGAIVYACYGAEANPRDAEAKVTKKLESDFARAEEQWASMTEWRFVTNAKLGPKATQALINVRGRHGQGSARPLTITAWVLGETNDDLWDSVLTHFPADVLDRIYPGAPGRIDIELSDILPLLHRLDTDTDPPAEQHHVLPPPVDKMDYNRIPHTTRAEFTEGRRYARRIAAWYDGPQIDPELRDRHGQRFTEIYRRHKSTIPNDPGGVVERIYEAIAGQGFRAGDLRTRTAAWAVTAYFFDQCDIFETPPTTEGGAGAVAYEGRLF